MAGIYDVNVYHGYDSGTHKVVITGCSHTSIPSGGSGCEFILRPADAKQTKWDLSMKWREMGASPDSFRSWCRETQSDSPQSHRKPPPTGNHSWRANESLVRNRVCLHLSICCSAVDICQPAGHSCLWWLCCAITAGTTWALSGDSSCSPDHLHLVVNLALRRSCALKQSSQTKPFLLSFSMMWFVKIVYGSLLPTHCCSYLKTYLDGILQSLLKFAWITLLILYCSTWIKWQAEMLDKIKISLCNAGSFDVSASSIMK